MSPYFRITVLTDGPRFKDLTDAMLGGDGSLWFYSGFEKPYTVGAVQTLDDRGTLVQEDDAWQVRPADYLPDLGYCERVTAFERSGSDSWYASYCYWRFPQPPKAVRYHGGERIEYSLPLEADQWVSDIFAQDQRHIWFATWDYWGFLGTDSGNVLSLDDGGTPADFSDDVWQSYPIEAVEGSVTVALDAHGQLWHGQASGLYRHDGAAWHLVYDERPICDLAPAADGTLYAQIGPDQATGCQEHSDEIMVVRADGTIEDRLFYNKWLIADELATVQTARRRNSLWSVAADGAVWYITQLDPGQELQRRSGAGLQTYALPVEREAVRRLEVDRRGHIWLVAGNRLWRLAGPRPADLYLPWVAR
jgi:hypothetical protein